MQQRVVRVFASLLALLEVKPRVEIWVRIAALARTRLQIMDQRINIALGDVRVGLEIVFGVEYPGFSNLFVVAEQRFHQVSWVVNRAASDREARRELPSLPLR